MSLILPPGTRKLTPFEEIVVKAFAGQFPTLSQENARAKGEAFASVLAQMMAKNNYMVVNGGDLLRFQKDVGIAAITTDEEAQALIAAAAERIASDINGFILANGLLKVSEIKSEDGQPIKTEADPFIKIVRLEGFVLCPGFSARSIVDQTGQVRSRKEGEKLQ